MEFFQKRLESLERELAAEKERAQSAQNALSQQATLRSEVESTLKNLTEQLRREKAEKETSEEKSHSRGRIDALEKRLDDMHQTWAALLKDAVAQRDGATQETKAAQAVMGKDVGALADGLRVLQTEFQAWRQEIAVVSELVPALRALAKDVPEQERRLLGRMSEQFAAFAAGVEERLSGWQRRQTLESEKSEIRMAELSRERAAIQKDWEQHNHAIRQEFMQERVSRESALEERIAEVCRRLDAMGAGQEQAVGAARELKTELAKVLSWLNTPPKAKDQIIAELEREKLELIKTLKDRGDTLAKYAKERREVENTMGSSMMELNARLDSERDKNRQAQGRIAEMEIEVKAAQDRLAAAALAAREKEKLHAMLAEDRDGLARALVAENEKARQQAEARGQAEAAGQAKLDQLQKLLFSEQSRGATQDSTIRDLRTQIATLTEHMAKALQEKDAVAARFSTWSQEREKLMGTIREKDEMISMLSSTFQGMLKKP